MGGNGGGGHIFYGVAITNHGKTARSLTGFPGVSLVPSQGSVVRIPESTWPRSSPLPLAILHPNQTAPALYMTFDGAYFQFEWTYCDGRARQVSAADIPLAGVAGVSRVTFGGLSTGSRCDSPLQGRGLGVGPIQGPSPDSIAVTLPALRVTLEGIPKTIVAGQTLRYTVTSTHHSGAPISFATRPGYAQGLTTGPIVSFPLNCAPL